MLEARRNEAELDPFRVPFTRKRVHICKWAGLPWSLKSQEKSMRICNMYWTGPFCFVASEMDTFRFTVFGLRELCACILNNHDCNITCPHGK
jgi:hypothetical protein